VEDEDVLERIRALAVPPAWKEVWICSDPMGHLQATGIDDAGRKQYLYHARWREHRDRAKFDRMTRFGAAMPKLRRTLAADLAGDEPSRRRVVAGAVRLLDIGMFRVGSEEYADDEGGVGLATIRKEHVSLQGGAVAFDYLGKSGVRRLQVIEDPASAALVAMLKRRRGGGPELLAFRDGRRWRALRSDDINDFLKQELGEEFSAKDFRTWNGTVMAAVAVATQGDHVDSQRARRRVIKQAVDQVAELLGNTPTVARKSYIDPRVFDRYLAGATIADTLRRTSELDVADDRTRNRVERAVLGLLAENRAH
jgi:DNA topoisomerase I